MKFCALVLGMLLNGPAALATDLSASKEVPDSRPGLTDPGDTLETSTAPGQSFIPSRSEIVPFAVGDDTVPPPVEGEASPSISPDPPMLENRVPGGFKWKK